MNRFTGSRRTMLLCGSAFATLFAQTAHAQVEAPDTEEPSANASSPEIVVTGSRIARPDYQANSPIVSVGEEAIENSGQVTVERALAQLPQFTGSFGQSNTRSTSTSLNGGQAYASLRGLGSKRTLLLLDGRRMQPSNPDGSVDLNIIPEALIENVEVITGGASTTYGSDATAGVVNFRLKRDFKGLTVGTQYGISDYGDGDSFRINGTLGGNFADGRGNAVLSVDYTKRWRALEGDRDYYFFRRTTPGLATIPQGNTIFGANRPTIDAVNSVFAGYGFDPISGSDGFYTGQIGFNTDQTLFTTSGVPVQNFRDPETDEAYIVDSGPNSQQINYGYADGALQADLERYTVFGNVDYELTDSIRSFLQFSYVNYESVATGNPTLASNVYGLSVPASNPFISNDFASILASRPDPTGDFTFYKAFNILGPRVQTYTYDVYQITGGFSGDLGIGDLTWDVYGSVSRAKFENEQTGGASDSALARLLYSPTGGTEYCEGGFNPFGNVTPSQECVDYIYRRTLNTNELKQRIVEGSVQGGLFDMPAGQVRFAMGADYRYNSYNFEPDAQLNQPDGTSDVLGFSVLRPAGGSVDTTEFFAELLVPLLEDIPLVQHLDLDLGYRYSDYSSVGGVHTYKADVDWQATDWLRFRGGYNRAIRAPSVGELYAPVSTGSVGIGNPTPTGSEGDPCDVRSSYRQGPNGDDVAALCLAQGVPDALINSYQLGTAQVFALTGGNPDLQEEKADTFSFGGVIRSPFYSPMLSGLSLSVDWYKIKVKDAVGPLSIAQGFQFCFNQGGNNPNFDPDNYYCSLIERNPDSGVPLNPVQPLLNLGQFSVSGIDVQLDWQLDLEELGVGANSGRIDINTAVSYLDSFEIQDLPGATTYDYAGSIGKAIESNAGSAHPTWKSVTSLTYSLGQASLGLRWRFIDSMKSSSQVVNPNSTTRGVEAYHIFDLNGRVMLPAETEMRVGITNLFNRKPPQVGNTQGNYDAQNYDVLGRYFFVGLKKSF
ncbi:TonB-dependent receptor [Altericroceibacterium spongiae]|uniref:TonB-dependent receptor n=1 Tax=Altericroceibacterium spongiae TaxID=2320269 RepID=A0A420ELY6_9SPHN|nr:TonB-dependent receptor [Altericroceibacterium spongiae]RKF21693.1 TonB-dependent receptor [Altericroceibacterium spongiae]